MTTTLRNSSYTNEINAFRALSVPVNPLPFLYGLAECVQKHGPGYVRTDEGKALLFVLLMISYGSLFTLDSVAEFERLDQTIPRA